MESKERLANAYLIALIPAGVIAAAWAVRGFPAERLGLRLVGLITATVLFSSLFRIQLPRTKIHLTVSDAVIMFTILVYGGEVAVVISILETTYSSYSLRRKGVAMKPKTILTNVLLGAVGVFITSLVVESLFGRAPEIYSADNPTATFWPLIVLTLSLFLCNSLGVSAFVAARTGKPLWRVWNDYCLNALVMYVSSAILAGFAVRAVQQINFLVLAAVAGFFALVYFTYRRYVEDIKRTSAKAEQAERIRAEQAESHVQELEHYVGELEHKGKELNESREMFRHAAYHDPLCGLPNRSFFLTRIRELIDKKKDDATFDFAVLFLDLNRFRAINDSLGHSTGDELIKQVAARLAESSSEGVAAGRFGGDEFALILENFDHQGAKACAERVAHRISEPYIIEGKPVFTGVSIGIALGGAEYQTAEELLRDADIAMYHAKDNDRSFVVFNRNMHTRAVSLLQLETDLRLALESGELETFYQPIVDLNSLKLVGFEALVRWNHPERGLIMPSDFIPLSEETGLIVPMTLQILRSSCRQMVQWQRRDPSLAHMSISVNISGKHFLQHDLVDQIKRLLAETRISPASLKLELTEGAVVRSAEDAISMLQQIKQLGVKLSIDDFGTGHSSLNYLHRFPVDTLKIDRSFVGSIESGGEGREIVNMVSALANALKLSVIAEGIETASQLEHLRELGCTFGQGYLFSPPVPASEAGKMLDESRNWQHLLSNDILALDDGQFEFDSLQLH